MVNSNFRTITAIFAEVLIFSAFTVRDKLHLQWPRSPGDSAPPVVDVTIPSLSVVSVAPSGVAADAVVVVDLDLESAVGDQRHSVGSSAVAACLTLKTREEN